jgi:hypothetical protein
MERMPEGLYRVYCRLFFSLRGKKICLKIHDVGGIRSLFGLQVVINAGHLLYDPPLNFSSGLGKHRNARQIAQKNRW